MTIWTLLSMVISVIVVVANIHSINKKIRQPQPNRGERRSIMEQQYYIVRADRAGVFFGQIESRNGSEVTMRNVRRIWRWEGANSISQLAVDGTKAGKICKFSVEVESMTILGVIEIIPCTAKATKSISEVPEWRF